MASSIGAGVRRQATLRPVLRRLAAGEQIKGAQRWAFAGLALTILAIGMMTRALYAGS